MKNPYIQSMQLNCEGLSFARIYNPVTKLVHATEMSAPKPSSIEEQYKFCAEKSKQVIQELKLINKRKYPTE